MATKTTSMWLKLPSVDFRLDPYFYFKYDGAWFLLLLGAAAAIFLSGWDGLITDWSWSVLGIFLVASYVQIMGSVLIHNASHLNFPRPINRAVGELFGLIIATRFASWEILHRQHHKYSDDRVLDPHPIINNFFTFVWKVMVLNLEKNLNLQYFERYGKTPETERREAARTAFSFITMLALMVFWYAVMGPVGFIAVYLPSLVVGIVHISHFNWATHDGANKEQNFRPINLNRGFYWLGNRLWFGLYFHANHHDNARLFNPMNQDKVLARRAKRDEDRRAAAAARQR